MIEWKILISNVRNVWVSHIMVFLESLSGNISTMVNKHTFPIVLCFGCIFLGLNHTLGDGMIVRYLNGDTDTMNGMMLALPFFLTTIIGHPCMIFGLYTLSRVFFSTNVIVPNKIRLFIIGTLALWLTATFLAGFGDLWYGMLVFTRFPGFNATDLFKPGLFRGISSVVILFSGGIVFPITCMVFLKSITEKTNHGPLVILCSTIFSVLFRLLQLEFGGVYLVLGFIMALLFTGIGLYLTGKSIILMALKTTPQEFPHAV